MGIDKWLSLNWNCLHLQIKLLGSCTETKMECNKFALQEWKMLALAVTSFLSLIVGIILISSSGSSSRQSSSIPTPDKYALTEDFNDPDPSTAIRILWPDGQVPYTMDSILGDKSKAEISESIEIFHKTTCVRFVQKTHSDEYWISFIHSNTLICSNSPLLGLVMSKKGMRKIKLAEQCIKKPIIEMLLARTLGLDFEETRPDRDNYIRLDSTCELGNISTKIPIGNHNQAALDIFFDYTSHMFRKSECLEPVQNGRINFGSSDDDDGTPGTLSVLDIEKLNAMYNCSGCRSYRFLPSAKVLDPAYSFESFKPFSGGLEEIYNIGKLYICRVYHLGDILIGKVTTSRDGKNEKMCWVEYYGREHSFEHSFEVLSAGSANLKWELADGSSIPTNAIIGGRTANRKPVYIGRCKVHFGSAETIVPGSIFPNVSVLKVPFNNLASICSTYEILVCGD